MSDLNRVVRQSQAAISYGVGSIYDVLGESFVLCDTSQWKKSGGRGREIYAERLIRSLSRRGFEVDKLNEPVEMEDARPRFGEPPNKGLPYLRFPRWLFCAECRRLIRWTLERERKKTDDRPGCPTCGSRYKLTPMRFIVICEDGHMGDVPWGRWAHSQSESSQQCSSTEDLEFLSRSGFGGGFASLAVRCRECGALRSLEGISGTNALKQVGWDCPGRQPWEFAAEREDCDRDIHVVQRGSGSVYYPSRASAITIPPESDRKIGESELAKKVRGHALYEHIDDRTTREALAPKIAADVGGSEEEVIQVLEEDEGERENPDSEKSIPTQEWEALIEPHEPTDSRAEFVNEALELIPDDDSESNEAVLSLGALIDRVMAVRKLREVRTLVGFYRHKPGGREEDDRLVKPDLDRGEDWLPATEVYGEGIFLTLNESKLSSWENNSEVSKRASDIESRREDSIYRVITDEATPRYTLLHTLSHLLIRRLAFSCGYSSASLRERIYADSQSGRAGILIYTADGDSEGTLGGLVRQAEPPRLASNLIAALYDARGCSSDPVCFESPGQGTEGMNLAACHACALVAETSCESMNLLLDRVMLIGNEKVPGFFAEALENALTAATG